MPYRTKVLEQRPSDWLAGGFVTLLLGLFMVLPGLQAKPQRAAMGDSATQEESEATRFVVAQDAEARSVVEGPPTGERTPAREERSDVLAGSKVLRIAICNVQNGIGTTRGYWHYLFTGWKYLLPHDSGPILQAAHFLETERVDLVALCEVGGGASRTRGVDQVALLAEAAALPEHVFFPTLVKGTKVNQGNAVCSRFPVRKVQNHLLPGTGEPRYLSEAEVTIEGVPTRLFVTHLSLQRALREAQLDRIADIIGHADRPTILAGDFNVSEEAELDLLVESNLHKAESAPTFPSWHPVQHLDYLFFSRHFTVRHRYAFDAFRFSDHLPFVADVVLDEHPDEEDG